MDEIKQKGSPNSFSNVTVQRSSGEMFRGWSTYEQRVAVPDVAEIGEANLVVLNDDHDAFHNVYDEANTNKESFEQHL